MFIGPCRTCATVRNFHEREIIIQGEKRRTSQRNRIEHIYGKMSTSTAKRMSRNEIAQQEMNVSIKEIGNEIYEIGFVG